MIQQQAVKRVLLLAPVSQEATATQAATVDCKDADYATIQIAFKSEKNTNAVGPDIALQHSDDTAVTNFATITADRTTEDLTESKLVVYHVDMRARKRYLRLLVTPETTTNDNTIFSAVAELGRLSEQPASTSDMLGSTNDAAVIVS